MSGGQRLPHDLLRDGATRDSSSAQALPGQPAGVAPWRVLAISCLAVALCFFIATAMGVLLPTVAQALQAGPVAAPWLVLAYWMATASLTLVFGRISDLWGRKPIFCGGLLLFALASGLSALSPNAPLLLILRALQGVAAAAIFANTATMVAHAYAGGPRLGMALGQLATAAALAQAAGPALGALIGELWGWRSAFGLTAVLALALLPLAWTQLPDDAPSATRDTTFDVFGALLCSAALGALCWGLTLAGRGQAVGQAALFLTLGSATLWALWQWVQRTPSPLVAPQLLRDPARWVSTPAPSPWRWPSKGRWWCWRFIASSRWAVRSHRQGLPSAALPSAWPRVRSARAGSRGAGRRRACAWLPWAACRSRCWGCCCRCSCAWGSGEVLMLWALGMGTALYVTPANQLLMQHCPPAHRGVVNALRSALQNAGILAGIAWLLSSVRLGLPLAAREALYTGSAARTAGGLVASDLHKAVMLALASLVLLLAAAQAVAWWLWRWHPPRKLPSSRTPTGAVEV